MKASHIARLQGTVRDYVEAASDYRPRLPEPIELDTIMGYTRMPGLLEVILDVLRQRLKQGYPWNLKALDILLWLQRHDALPRLQDSTTLQSFLPTLRELFYSPPDDPKGAAMHVKLKADDVLRKFGFEMPARPDPFGGFLRQNAGPGEWEGWSWSASGWSWGPPPASPSRSAWTEVTDQRAWNDFAVSTTTMVPGSLDQGALKDHESRHARSLEKMVPRKRWWER